MRSKPDASAARFAVAILRRADAATEADRMSVIREGLDGVPDDLKPAVETSVLAGLEAGGRQPAAMSDPVLVAIGLSLIALGVLLTIFIPAPTQVQDQAMGIVFALGSAFAGAALPGALTVELSTKAEGAIRATGSLGLIVFSILYWSGILSTLIDGWVG